MSPSKRRRAQSNSHTRSNSWSQQPDDAMMQGLQLNDPYTVSSSGKRSTPSPVNLCAGMAETFGRSSAPARARCPPTPLKSPFASSGITHDMIGVSPLPPILSHVAIVTTAPTPPSYADKEHMFEMDGVSDEEKPGTPPLPEVGTPKKRLKQCPDTPVKTPLSSRAIAMASSPNDLDMAFNTEWMDGDQWRNQLDSPCTCDLRDGHPCASPACVQLGVAQSLRNSNERMRLSSEGENRRLSMLPRHRRSTSLPISPDGAALGIPPPPRIPRQSHGAAPSPLRSPRRISLCNVNPFSPDANLLNSSAVPSATPANCSAESTGEDCDSFTSFNAYNARYEDEFEEVATIGEGSFGRVFQVRKRLDGWKYAIKRSTKPMRSHADRKNHLKEVYALAAVGDCPHVIRYYDAWFEGDVLFIQTEFCEKGTLADVADRRFAEQELLTVLKQIATGLRHLHSMNLVHLDIKPENIYIASNGFFKIGDFGLVSRADAREVSEGDSRYLCRELLNEDWSNLPKADVFALGMSLYELASGRPLPSQGEEWNAIRDGHIVLPGFSDAFVNLIKQLLHSDPNARPSCIELLDDPLLRHLSEDSVSRLHAELVTSSQTTLTLQRDVQHLRTENVQYKHSLDALRDTFSMQQEWIRRVCEANGYQLPAFMLDATS
eukprot:TRINITY_DN2787_c0_g1_i1.p1 TRINITY_DN2787_c0_g1~~TRINITY_DN2787_c0_g1_i1.p1  ORF type:complete len:756 (+),score=105.18 TRINITY_DN2787_c0_g1_i1:286-2268(+)